MPVGSSHAASLAPPLPDRGAGTTKHDVEVHAVDADAGIVLDSQVDVLLDTEPEVSIFGKVLSPQLILLHLEASLEDLLGLGSPDGAVDGDLLVPPDAERPDGVAGLGEDGCLSCQRLQDLSGPCKPVTRLTHADVQAELLDCKEIFIKMMDWIRNYDTSNEEYTRRIRFTCHDGVNDLARRVLELGDLKMQENNPGKSSDDYEPRSSGLSRSKSDHRLVSEFRRQEENSSPTRSRRAFGYSREANKSRSNMGRYGGEEEDDSSYSSSRFSSRFLSRTGDDDGSDDRR